MYRALIVDDEKMIRLGMRKVIPWTSLDISEVFVAKSGDEAMTIIREHKPEIMITDIKMNGMTGLDLIGNALALVPAMRILVLTGYDDFEYARRCIKLNVHDFFLKPIDEKALMDSLRKQVASLQESKTDRTEDVHVQRAQAVVEQVRIDRFLRRMVSGEFQHKEDVIREFCARYHYDMRQQLQVAVLVPMLFDEHEKANHEYNTLTIRNICISMVDAQRRGLTFIDDAGRIVIVYFLNNRQRGILEWVQELNGILKDEYGENSRVVVGNSVQGFFELCVSYDDAILLLSEELASHDDIILTQIAMNRKRLFREVFSEMKNAITSHLMEPDGVMRIYDYFCQAVESYHLSEPYIRKCCFEIGASAYYAAVIVIRRDVDTSLSSFISGLTDVNTEEILEMTRQFLARLTGRGEEEGVHELVGKTKAYIMEHLSDDLSVASIAAQLYVTPNYLSRLFKKETGEGCNAFIVRNRMEKAKSLLRTTNLSVGRIASIVGYHDTNYFSMAIKKSTDMSPTKYRESVVVSFV